MLPSEEKPEAEGMQSQEMGLIVHGENLDLLRANLRWFELAKKNKKQKQTKKDGSRELLFRYLTGRKYLHIIAIVLFFLPKTNATGMADCQSK